MYELAKKTFIFYFAPVIIMAVNNKHRVNLYNELDFFVSYHVGTYEYKYR